MHDLPPAADPNRAAVDLEGFRATAGPAGQALADDPQGQALLMALFGNSPFLGGAVLAEPAFLLELLAAPSPDVVFDRVLAALTHDMPDLGRHLRHTKRRVALLAAVADIGGLWSLDQVTGALSTFAERALDLGVANLLAAAAARGEIELVDPARPGFESSLAIIGMGKLGARELNYSSDIDIIVLFDETKVRYRGSKSPQECFVRVTRELVALMQDRTADGYVFRTDLRLRPDPGATAVALSMGAAEYYYESLGQNWERAAMIKARTVAGDIAAGADFLDRIGPFVWRKNLDFAAIEDIHSIKRQIHAHKGHGTVTVAGHDIKLGRGGIREIEFFAQTQQLIAGGRDRRLREKTTCGAIRALRDSGRLTEAVAQELIDAYGFLRTLEHRLQMVDDQQTHRVPAEPDALRHIAVFMGFAEIQSFSDALLAVLERVQRHYAALFEAEPSLGSHGSLVFTGTDEDPETLKTLASMGFRDTAMVSSTIRRWHHGRYRAMKSARARELLTALKPHLLEALAATSNPDQAFLHFDEFLGRLPAGIQLFSLFNAKPDLLTLVAEIMGTAPRLAATLARYPHLLDAVVVGQFSDPLPAADVLETELAIAIMQGKDFQDALDTARRFAAEREFQVGVQMMRRKIDVDGAAGALSDLADAVLANMLHASVDDLARSHGRVPGGDMAVVGFGKLGAREMTFGSDLDLIFIYDHPAEAETSDGAQKLPAATWFARLSQRVINALTALTPEGRLYEVDMRLRPSGNAGPVAVRLESFAKYQRTEAWTWEHMALTRARPVAGPLDLRQRIDDIRREVLTAPRDPARLYRDVAEMHAKTVTAHGSRDKWDLKYAAGGLLDAEFIAQCLVLRHAPASPQVLTGNTVQAFRLLARNGLLPAGVELAEATRFIRSLQMLQRLCVGPTGSAETFAGGLQALLAAAGDAPTFAALEAALADIQARVRRDYEQLVEQPARDYESGQRESSSEEKKT